MRLLLAGGHALAPAFFLRIPQSDANAALRIVSAGDVGEMCMTAVGRASPGRRCRRWSPFKGLSAALRPRKPRVERRSDERGAIHESTAQEARAIGQKTRGGRVDTPGQRGILFLLADWDVKRSVGIPGMVGDWLSRVSLAH